MALLRESIRKHQLVAFFVLTCAISWLLWIPLIQFPGEMLELVGLFGIFGPALACIVLLRVIPRGPRPRRSKITWIAFFTAWMAATAIFLLYLTVPSPSDNLPVLAVVAALAALPAALVIAAAVAPTRDGSRGISTLVRPSGHVVWYLLALLMIPAIRLLSVPISLHLGWGLFTVPDMRIGGMERAGLVAVSFLYTLIYAGGLNEETGWTGFALPRLQAQFSPFLATIILWFFWILWHMPLQLAGYWNAEMESLVFALVGTFFARFLFTWLFNHSKGGILTAVLLHTSANVAAEFIPLTFGAMILEAGLAIVVILGDRMWRRLPADVPQVCSSGKPDEGHSPHFA